MKLHRLFFIACLGSVPLQAQQVEPRTESPQRRADADTPQEDLKPAAYFGVLTREVPEELRAQFSLAEGFGLLVYEVMPDSPAKAAGLKKHDVLVKFEDQQLVNMEQLMALVHAKKKGDVVQLDVISGGKETQVPITLGERMVEADGHHPHHDHHGQAQPNDRHDQRGAGFQNQNQGNGLQEQMERFQQEMREYQQRIQEWSKSGGHGGTMPQPPQLSLPGHEQQHGERERHKPGRGQPETGITIPPGANVQQFNFSQSQTNVTRRDDSGEYSIKSEDGKKTFTARPAKGSEKSWPINTDAERQAVPQEFRDKLRMMDETNGGIHIEINPGPGGNAAPGNQQAPPPVKKKTTSA